MVTGLFQTYEGELKLVGPRKLLWHRLAINPQRMQVLPARQRKFPFAPKRLAGAAEAGTSTAAAADVRSENSSKYGITRGRERDVTDEAFAATRSSVLDALADPARLAELAHAVVLPLIADSLAVHRYQDKAVLLGLFLLSAMEQRGSAASPQVGQDSGSDSYATLVETVSQRLSVLFAAQADLLQDCQGEEVLALLWLQRAEQVRTCAHASTESASSAEMLQARLPLHLPLALLRKLSRSSRLAGELTAYRHYALLLQAAAAAAAAMPESAGHFLDGNGDGSEFTLVDARREVTRMHAALLAPWPRD
jgi:hypothetical protein